MERYKAKIIEKNDNHFLCLCIKDDDSILIPLTEDNPNTVKSVFNQLIVLLKKGKFEFYMEDVGTDLFSQVANEYIQQLNKELIEVYGELEHHNLVEPVPQLSE